MTNSCVLEGPVLAEGSQSVEALRLAACGALSPGSQGAGGSEDRENCWHLTPIVLRIVLALHHKQRAVSRIASDLLDQAGDHAGRK